MRRYALIVALALLAASPASAQSFLKGLARSAAEGVARDLVNGAVNRAMAGPQTAQEQEGDDIETAAAEPAAAPKPKRVAAPSIRDIPKPADAEAKKAAFDEFGRYPCTACEGGRGYDSWGRQILNVSGYNAWEKKVGALGLGEAITWQGTASRGELIVAGETEINGFLCKQITHRLTRVKTQDTAEREGLFCQGASGWVEVY